GFFYLLDAADGRFIGATPYVEGIAWTAGIDPVSGRPFGPGPDAEIGAAGLPMPSRFSDGCPNIRGVPSFPATYSERTGLSYGSGADGCRPSPPGGPASATGWPGGHYAGAARVT